MALNGFVVKHQFFLTSWYYPNEESNLRPLDSAPRCSNHWVTADFTVSEVYHEVHMTRVLHTVRISNVDSVMFVNRIREILSFDHRSVESESLRFDSSWVLNNFSLSHARDKTALVSVQPFRNTIQTEALSSNVGGCYSKWMAMVTPIFFIECQSADQESK